MDFKLYLGMDRAKGPFVGRIALDLSEDRIVGLIGRRSNDYQWTARIKQTGMVHARGIRAPCVHNLLRLVLKTKGKSFAVGSLTRLIGENALNVAAAGPARD